MLVLFLFQRLQRAIRPFQAHVFQYGPRVLPETIEVLAAQGLALDKLLVRQFPLAPQARKLVNALDFFMFLVIILSGGTPHDTG